MRIRELRDSRETSSLRRNGSNILLPMTGTTVYPLFNGPRRHLIAPGPEARQINQTGSFHAGPGGIFFETSVLSPVPWLGSFLG